MKAAFALAALCALSACASTYAANPSDPVDMAAALGDRGARYVGMAETCDASVGGDYSGRMAQIVSREQLRLGVLRGLVNRAYHGQPTTALRAHMQSEMAENGLTAAQFCDEVLRQASTDMIRRTDAVLAPSDAPLTLEQARNAGWIE